MSDVPDTEQCEPGRAAKIAAAVLRLTPEQWLAHQARQHIFYEKRTDRKNFYELLKFVDAGLA